MSEKQENALNFEVALARLQEIVRSMERGDVSLEESMKLFEEGTALVRKLGKRLDEAELKVVQLSKGTDGQPVEGSLRKMSDFEARLGKYQTFIEDYLKELCEKSREGQPQETLYEAMAYSLLAGGKRLRPVLTLEFCRMCGGDPKKAAPLAAAVEMIHTYSLIHDDLPCMDNDDFRRGKPTNHKVYGEAMAVLAGDALLTDAFGLAAGADIPAGRMPRIISVLSQNAGSYGMVGGQVLDMQSETRACTEQEVLDIQSRKTGALINSACALGVLAAGGTEAQLQAACGFAGLMGLAFQIRDDMLDVIGQADKLGKATNADEGKNTFVQLYGLSKCEELVKKYTDRAIGLLSAFENHEFMDKLAKKLVNRDN